MKRTLITTTGICLAMAIHAQESPAPPAPLQLPAMEERLQKTNEMLDKELQLSAPKKKSIESVLKDFFVAADQLRNEMPPPPPPPPPPSDPKIKAAMDNLKLQRDEKVKNILSTEEFEKYQDIMKKSDLPKPPAPPPPPLQKKEF
jgi:hypothetical protein